MVDTVVVVDDDDVDVDVNVDVDVDGSVDVWLLLSLVRCIICGTLSCSIIGVSLFCSGSHNAAKAVIRAERNCTALIYSKSRVLRRD